MQASRTQKKPIRTQRKKKFLPQKKDKGNFKTLFDALQFGEKEKLQPDPTRKWDEAPFKEELVKEGNPMSEESEFSEDVSFLAPIPEAKIEKVKGIDKLSRVDQTEMIEQIVNRISVSEISSDQSRALVSLNLGGAEVRVQILKRKGRTKVIFRTEDSKIRRLLRTSKQQLKDGAKVAGIHLERIEVE